MTDLEQAILLLDEIEHLIDVEERKIIGKKHVAIVFVQKRKKEGLLCRIKNWLI